jgi:hypothetical protein
MISKVNMRKAVAFRFDYPEQLCLFPEIESLYVFEDERWSRWENKQKEDEWVDTRKRNLSQQLHTLGYTHQNVEGELWSFQNPQTKQTYFYYIKIHQRFRNLPGYLQAHMHEADTLFSGMLVSSTLLQRMPKLKHFVGISDSHYNPDSDDWDDAERKPYPITFFLWHNPGYLETYTAVAYSEKFEYDPNGYTADYIRQHCITTRHLSLQDMSAYYKQAREAMIDSESEEEKDVAN